MIALVPSAADLDRLALPGGEARDDLHLTLWYLGPAADHTAEDYAYAVDAVRRVVEGMPVVAGNAFGVAHWNPGGDSPAWVLNVGDSPDGSDELTAVRERVAESWDEVDWSPPTQHTPWQPHVCLAYSSNLDLNVDLELRLGPITFDRVRVAFGSEVTDVQLAYSATVAAGQGGDAMPWHVVRDHSECPAGKPWAVVKNATGRVEGCHATEGEADDHMRALYANEPSAAATYNLVFGEDGVPRLVAVPTTNATASDVDVECADCGDDAAHFGSGGSVSSAPWDGSSSRFTDQEYRHSAAACDPGNEPPKSRCFLPHHEPGGAVNRAAVHNAAARVSQLKGHSPEAVARAKAHLRGHYHQLGEPVPDSLKAEAETVALAAAPDESSGPGDSRHDDCPEGQRKMPDGSCAPATYAAAPPQGTCPDGHHMMPDGSCMSDAEMAAASRWQGVLCVEGVPTGDGREFAPDALTWADQALLRWQKEGSHGGNHDVTVSVGRIDRVWRDGNVVHGEGVLDLLNPDGFEVWRRMGGNFAGGISIDADDIADADVEFVWAEDDEAVQVEDDVIKFIFGVPEKMIYHAGRVRAATLVDIPAFVEARIALVGQSDEALVASAETNDRPVAGFVDELVASLSVVDEWQPPRSWFENPKLNVPTSITVTDQGRVYGHVAPWGTCHIGYADECVETPYEETHPYFLTGEVVCADGSRVAVGQITVGTGHAPLSYSPSRAVEHYDNTGSAVVDVVIGNDAHGIWCAGAVRPHADAQRVHDLRASGRVSGDWRRIGGKLRLVGVLAVNVGGFTFPNVRARVASGVPQALVAAGTHIMLGQAPTRPERTETELDQLAMRRVMEILARRVHADTVTEGA